MAKISPFRAVRPNKVYVESVASFPYDVVSSAEARIIAADNPLSFLHISKAEIDFPEDVTFSDPAVYEKAKSNLRLFQDREILIQDAKPLFYIYSQKMGEHRQYGIVATVDVSEFESGQVKRHELTLPEKQEDRTRHFETLCAQTGPIFLAYRANEEINRIVEEVVSEDDPEYDFTMPDGIQHTVWIISGAQQISAITKIFARIDSLYIADGHHRAASAVEVARRLRNSNKNHAGNEEYNFILSVLFPHDQLKIMDYNRAVVDLNGLSKTDFMKNISESFDVEEDFKEKSPQSLHHFGMYVDGKWYKLIAKPACFETKDIIGALDVSILQNCLLKPILGIGDPRQDKRIKFIGGIRGMAELEKIVDSGDYAVAFSMYPPTLDQMFQVADAGEIMPPKSTWFEPKLRSGLFVHLLDQ
jgi:uncharacterized protein (DUF1015 family)